MIIDFHFHPFCKEATWQDLDQIAEAMWGLNPTQKKRLGVMLTNLATKYSIDNYINLMDKLHIERAVIVSFNVKTALGISLVTNDDIANFVEKYPEKFIGFAGIDPPAPDALEQLEYSINSLDLKGVKIVPPVQKFDLKDDIYNPIWEKIIDMNIPLWIHGGHQVSTAGSVAKYGHPMRIDDLAMRYPEMTIIIGHMGTPWFWDTYSVVIRHPHVYVDISAHPELYQYFPWDAYTSYNIENKVLFASDHPLCHWNQLIPAVKQLPISESFKKKIFKKNAEKLLKSFKII
jgi:hypothetical protein